VIKGKKKEKEAKNKLKTAEARTERREKLAEKIEKAE